MSKDTHFENSNLFDAYRNYTKGKWRKPDWQRDRTWDEGNVTKWMHDIDSCPKGKKYCIPGSISLATLENESPNFSIYVNDGMNRIESTVDYVEDKKLKGFSSDEIEDRLMHCKIVVQSSVCIDAMEALEDHEKLNRGTISTTYEKSNAYLAIVLPDFAIRWKPILHGIDLIIDNAVSPLGVGTMNVKKVGKTRTSTHKQLRDNRALFLRWATHDASLRDYSSSSSQIDSFIDKTYKSDIPFEHELVDFLKQHGSKSINDMLDCFKQHLENEVANLFEIRKSKEKPRLSFVKSILHLSIYRQSNNIPVDKYNKFIEELNNRTYGGTTTSINPSDVDRNNGLKPVTMGLGSLTWLTNASTLLGNNSMIDYTRRIKGKKLLPGYHNSHTTPFADDGNGPTVIEPAPINLSRGRKPV